MSNIPNENQPLNTNSSLGAEKLTQGQKWNIEVMFNNHNSSQKKYQMSPNHILELAIEDDILDWPTKGYLIYQNKQEGIERNINDQAWYYRMDARDELTIKVKPLFIEDSDITFPPEIWEMGFEFVIYDVEDLPASNIETKAKKIYFWDKRYQMMMDKNIQWSTATTSFNTNLKGKKPAQATDDERSMFTGDAIRALLIDAGFGEWIADFIYWDKGKAKILYTSPSEYSIIDDLKYLLKIHLSSDGDICLFNKDRASQKWQLRPMNKIFDKAGKAANEPGDLQLEHFFFEDQIYGTKNTTPFKAPYSREISGEKDIKLTGYNTIHTYQFVDMSGLDNEKVLNSKPVYWYDNSKKQFGVDFKDNEVLNVREKFKSKYVDKLLGENPTPLFTINYTKTSQYNIDPQFVFSSATSTTSKDMRSLFGMGKILFGGLFLNECISFRVLGSTHRIAGMFAGIDRLSNKALNGEEKFDNKICGQWFITNVKHIWKLNKYVNDVILIKIHSYDEMNINEDVE